MAGIVSNDGLALEEVHRFDHSPRHLDGHLRWDMDRIADQIEHGLGLVAQGRPELESIGVDTWAVDYGLLDDRGALVDEPISHRDDRTTAAVDRVHRLVPASELYELNGLQHLPFTTLFQLAADQDADRWAAARHAVLLPDLLAHRLTGELATEVTNASTTGLVDVRTGDWCTPLLQRLSIPADLFPPLQEAGAIRGELTPATAGRTGLDPSVVVTTVGSHDTASAVVGMPATDDEVAYVSSGTWSLVGIELHAPVLTEAARTANFTNERGVDGRIRFLRNVGGLWLLQESLRTWSSPGRAVDLAELLDRAAALPTGGPVIDVDDEAFIAPGDMPARICATVRSAGGHLDGEPPAVTRCILDSLASAYAATVHRAAELTGRRVRTIHLLGGGSRNRLLCQLTADAADLPVLAGPAEATAWGNVLVQARAIGALPGSLESLRARLAASVDVVRYEPS